MTLRMVDPLADARGITPEREHQAQGFSEWGQTERGLRTIRTMLDSPIERARIRWVITSQQYDAAVRYRRHWYLGGLAGPQSPQLDRIFGADVTKLGLPKTDAQVFHREQFRKAVECIGVVYAAVLDQVVCRERSLEQVAKDFQWKSVDKGIDAVTKMLRGALQPLVELWGI